jgi:autophagy-related protein 9
LFVTLWLSVILFAFVDWQELIKCTDEQSCKAKFGDYLIQKVRFELVIFLHLVKGILNGMRLHRRIQPLSHFSIWNCVVILYCILFTAYGMFSIWSFWRTVQDAFKTKQFFEDRLGISEQRLEGGAVDWDRDVVSKLIELQEKGDYQITIHGQGILDALVISQRILRKDNFMVAFFNRGLLDLHIPFIPQLIYCKSLEWAIYFCVLNYMYNHKFQIRPGFYLDPKSLRRRFLICGLAHAVFLPFLAFFMVLHFIMQNGYDWKSRKQYLGPKEWSLAARWTFREFNELPHFFERRLGPSYEATEEYLKLFRQSEVTTTVGRILAFVGGAFAALLFGLAAVNDAILLHVKIGNFNLLWFVGIATMCYSAGKSMLPDPESHTRYIWNLNEEMDQALTLMATHTHHYPDTWKRKGYDMKTMSIVKSMFTNKTTIFIHELIALVLAPLILCYSLPRCAEDVCEFVMTIKAEVPGAGDLCGYSTFDFDTFGDDSFEGKTMGDARGNVAASVAELQNVEAATRLHPKPKAYHGKMEKSFFSFKACHPNWTSTKSGQTLLDRVEHFKEVESRALAIEQQQHLEAAVRQLETLARMQQRNQTESPLLVALRESYIGGHSPQPSGADSGGGGAASPIVASFDHNFPLAISERNLASPIRIPPLVPPPRNRQITPPPFSLHDSFGGVSTIPRQGMLSQIGANQSAQSVLHYTDMGLSTELRRMLSRSTLDPDMSATASILGAYEQSLPPAGPSHGQLSSLLGNDLEEQQRRSEQAQYLWLQRYHARMAERRTLGQPAYPPSVDESEHANSSEPGH